MDDSLLLWKRMQKVCVVHKGQFQTAWSLFEEVTTLEAWVFVQTNSKILSSGFNFCKTKISIRVFKDPAEKLDGLRRPCFP